MKELPNFCVAVVTYADGEKETWLKERDYWNSSDGSCSMDEAEFKSDLMFVDIDIVALPTANPLNFTQALRVLEAWHRATEILDASN